MPFFLRVSLEERAGKRAGSGVRERGENKIKMEKIDGVDRIKRDQSGKMRICRYFCGWERR